MKNNNIKIEMVFDVSEEKVGIEIGGIFVYYLDELEERLLNDI